MWRRHCSPSIWLILKFHRQLCFVRLFWREKYLFYWKIWLHIYISNKDSLSLSYSTKNLRWANQEFMQKSVRTKIKIYPMIWYTPLWHMRHVLGIYLYNDTWPISYELPTQSLGKKYVEIDSWNNIYPNVSTNLWDYFISGGCLDLKPSLCFLNLPWHGIIIS